MGLINRIRYFGRDQHASLSVEAVLILPLLLWAYFGMFILFEGYRSLASNTRASYTVADLLSRETDYVTPTYLAGMNDILDLITQSPHPTALRVSVVSYDNDAQRYNLEWSHGTRGVTDVTDASLDSELMPYIPIMASPGVAIVVETFLSFEPFMSISLDAFNFHSVTITRPRFAAQVVWSDV